MSINNLNVNIGVTGFSGIMVWDENPDVRAPGLGFNSGSISIRLYRRQLASVDLNFFTCKTEELDK